MAQSQPDSVQYNMELIGPRLRIDDLEIHTPSSTSYLQGKVALVWPYSSVSQRLSFLLVEDVPTKNQLKVTFHGPVAREVAHHRVGIGDSIKLGLDHAKLAANCDVLSTPGKKSRVELHLYKSVLIYVTSEVSEDKRISFVSAADFATGGYTGISHSKQQSQSGFGSNSNLKVNIRLSSGSISEFQTVSIDRDIDPFAPHKRKRTKFARDSGAWRLTDGPDEKSHDDDDTTGQELLRQSAELHQPNLLQDLRSQILVHRDAGQAINSQTFSNSSPIARDAILVEDQSVASSDGHEAIETPVEAELIARPHKHLHSTRTLDNHTLIPDSPLLDASAASNEIISSSPGPSTQLLFRHTLSSDPVPDDVASLRASDHVADAGQNHDRSQSGPDTIVFGSSSPIDTSKSLAPVRIYNNIIDEGLNSIDLDFLQQQIDLEHAIGSELESAVTVQQDQTVRDSPLPPPSHFDQGMPPTTSHLETQSENRLEVRPTDEALEKSRLATELVAISGIDAIISIVDLESEYLPPVPLPTETQTAEMNVSGDGNDLYSSPSPALQQQVSAAIAAHAEESPSLGHDPLGSPTTDPTRTVGPGIHVEKIASESEVRNLEFEVDSRSDAEAESALLLQYRRGPGDGAITPPPTQMSPLQLLSPKMRQTAVIPMPPTPSDSQIQQQTRTGLDGLVDERSAKDPIGALGMSQTLASSAQPGSSTRLLLQPRVMQGLSSDYFTPPRLSELENSSEVIDTPSYIDMTNVNSSSQHQSEWLAGERKGERNNEGGMSTTVSYYPSLKSLLEYYGQAVDIIAMCTASSTQPQRAKTGPKHYHTTVHLADTSLPTNENTTVTVQLFRHGKDALPVAECGDVLLFRNVKVQTRSHTPFLVSSDESAWAVFKFDETSEMKVEIAGPPVEFGELEEAKAQSLRGWWLQTGVSSYTEQLAITDLIPLNNTPKRTQRTKKKLDLHIDLRRSPRRVSKDASSPINNTLHHEHAVPSRHRRDPGSPSNPRDLSSRDSMPPPPTTPSWSAVTSPMGHEKSASVPPTPSVDRSGPQFPPRSPMSETWTADAGSTITAASVVTTSSSRRRLLRQSTSLVHELRDGTQYVDVEEEELVSISASEDETAAIMNEQNREELYEKQRKLPSNKKKPKQTKRAVLAPGEKLVTDSTAPSKTMPASNHQQVSVPPTIGSEPVQGSVLDSKAESVPVERPIRLTRSQTRDKRDT